MRLLRTIWIWLASAATRGKPIEALRGNLDGRGQDVCSRTSRMHASIENGCGSGRGMPAKLASARSRPSASST